MTNQKNIEIGSKVRETTFGAEGYVFQLTTGNGAHVKWDRDAAGIQRWTCFGTKVQIDRIELIK